MGTISAPTYENLTVGFFELTFYDLFRNKFKEDSGNFIFENWSRFLDDCETLLEENKINPNNLLNTSDSINPSIQFTMEYSKDAIPFLDILIKCNNEKSWIDTYFKSTNIIGAFLFPPTALTIAKRTYLLQRQIQGGNKREVGGGGGGARGARALPFFCNHLFFLNALKNYKLCYSKLN